MCKPKARMRKAMHQPIGTPLLALSSNKRNGIPRPLVSRALAGHSASPEICRAGHKGARDISQECKQEKLGF